MIICLLLSISITIITIIIVITKNITIDYNYQVITILDIHKTVQHYFYLVGGFNPSEQYEGQLGLLFLTEWTNKIHVPNHQPDYAYSMYSIHIFHRFSDENLHFSRGSNSSRPCEAHTARPHGHLPIQPTSRSPSLTTPARAKSHFTEASKKPWSHGTHGTVAMGSYLWHQ